MRGKDGRLSPTVREKGCEWVNLLERLFWYEGDKGTGQMSPLSEEIRLSFHVSNGLAIC